MQQNNLEGYLGAATAPINPYANKAGTGRAVSFGAEYRQAKGDISMALYNQQVAEARMLKERQWALDDRQSERDYNSPSEQRKRLEEAGFNPALMSGMMQSAGAPVTTRGTTGSAPSGQLSNNAGVNNQTMANLMQAGQNVVSNMVSSKQAQVMDSNVQLNRAAAIKEMSQAAYTNSSKMKIDQLLEYEKNAMEMDIQRKQFDLEMERRYRAPIIEKQLEQMSTSITSDKQGIKESIARVANQNKLTPAQVNQINANIREIEKGIERTSQLILNDKQTLRDIQYNVSLKQHELFRSYINSQVLKATKEAQAAKPYVDIITDYMSLGLMSKFISK